jgi:ribose 5-phosphate isomerase A
VLPESSDHDDEKRRAARAAADLVTDGMSVGLGTGSTVAHLLPALAERELGIRCVATSPRTESAARGVGLPLEPFERLDTLDIAIDGADQVTSDGWLVKGGGGAHTREKIVAAAAERFVVIVDSTKLASRIAAPVPLELQPFGLRSTLHRLGAVRLRDSPLTPDGGVLADYHGELADPASTAEWLATIPGVVEHGLFAPALVDEVIVGRDGGVERLVL